MRGVVSGIHQGGLHKQVQKGAGLEGCTRERVQGDAQGSCGKGSGRVHEGE